MKEEAVDDTDRAYREGFAEGEKKSAAEIERTRDHLMMVLVILQDLHPNDRCRALDEAQAFYNAARPHQRVETDGTQYMRLTIVPLDDEQKLYAVDK